MHVERHAELVVAVAAAESAYPAAEQAVAADELARLTEMNRQLGQLHGGRSGAAGAAEVEAAGAEGVGAEAAGEDALGDAAEDGDGFLSQERLAAIAQRIADQANARHVVQAQ